MECIYLKHCYRAHYEVVLSVEDQNINISKPSANTAMEEIVRLVPKTSMPITKEVSTENETFNYQCASSDNTMEEPHPITTGKANLHHWKQNLQGSCHQGHPKFGASAGKQRVLNSLASLMYCNVKHTKNWDVTDMNVVLNTGNELYKFLAGSSTMHNDYVLVTEIPRQIECFNKEFTFEFHDSLYGLISPGNCEHDSGFQSYTVNEALGIALVESDGAFVTFKGNTYIILKDRHSFYVFDPHSRDMYGKVSRCGTSILLEFHTIEELSSHCAELANSMKTTRLEQFEITGVKVANSCGHSHQ